MSFQFDNLDRTTRRHMRAEFFLDLTQDRVHLPDRLNASGRLMFPVALEAAIEKGDDATFADSVRGNGFVREWEEGHTRDGRAVQKHVPWNAADVICEDAFNRYYVRGICRRALEEGIDQIEIYRAKEVAKPRAGSESRVGTFLEPRRLLDDLRAHVADAPELGIPAGPGSGLSVRLPAKGAAAATLAAGLKETL